MKSICNVGVILTDMKIYAIWPVRVFKLVPYPLFIEMTTSLSSLKVCSHTTTWVIVIQAHFQPQLQKKIVHYCFGLEVLSQCHIVIQTNRTKKSKSKVVYTTKVVAVVVTINFDDQLQLRIFSNHICLVQFLVVVVDDGASVLNHKNIHT